MIRKIISIGLSCALLLSGTAVYAQQSQGLTLDQAINIAIDNSTDIRKLLSSLSSVEEQVRKADAGVKQTDWYYEKYEKYKRMYYDSDDTYDKYIDMTSSELMNEIGSLSVRLMNNRNPQTIDQILDDIEFIEYMLTFGGEEPDLTQVEIYRKFVKNIETIGVQAKNELTKYQNNIALIEGNLATGVTQTFMGILDLTHALNTQNNLLVLREDILKDLEQLLEEGLISEYAVYQNRVEIDKLKSEIIKLGLQKKNMEYALNNLLGRDIETPFMLEDYKFTEKFLPGKPIEDYVAEAIGNSALLEAMRIDLKFYEDNLRLYEEYDGYTFGSEYEDLTDQIKRLTMQLQESEWLMETNVRYAIGDLIAKDAGLEREKLNYQNAFSSLNQAAQQQKLGLLKATDVHQVQLQLVSALMSLSQAERALESSIMKFGMLIDYGVEYK